MPSANTRLIRLLDRGFYPIELPPPFRTKHFSRLRHSFSPPQNYYGSTTFFDGATFRGSLRSFGVINPVNYFLLSQFIANHWRDISQVYQLSSCSGSRPEFPARNAPGRAIHGASLTLKRKSQSHLASSYPTILALDINRFYGSIYTHSIPWAALGKQQAKRKFRSGSLKAHWSNSLDTLVRNCNQQQTVGVPIGPDTSRIVSELILSRIDSELTAQGSSISSRQIFHNIDDYQIGGFDRSSIENAQSRFVRTISKYELRLNDHKTSIDEGIDFSPAHFQVYFDILSRKTGKGFVNHFFELLYSEIPRHPNSNVLGYALKQFALPLAKNPEQFLVREYLQRLIFATPHQARWVLPLLLGIYRQQGVDRDVKRLLSWGVETCARRNDIGNLLWFLYSAIFLQVRLKKEMLIQCIGMSNCLVDLVLFHGRSLGLFSFGVRELRNRYVNADFQSDAWLPLYEIERRHWDTSAAFNKLQPPHDKHNLYDIMRQKGVEFYCTKNESFSVECFAGWKLTQAHFEDGARRKERERNIVNYPIPVELDVYP